MSFNKTQTKVFEKIVRGDNRFIRLYHPERLGKFLCTDGFYYFTDGYRIIKCKDDVPEIPLSGEWDYLQQIVEQYHDFVDVKNRFPVPRVEILKPMLSLKKREIRNKFYIYTVGDDSPLVNMQHLIDILTIMPCSTFVYSAGVSAGLYFNSIHLPRIEAVLYPVTPPKDDSERELYKKITCRYSF